MIPAFLLKSARSARLHNFDDSVQSLWQREPIPWPSLMDVFVGHQHRNPNPPLWPLQSVPRPSTISMEIVGLQNPQTCHKLPGSSSSSVSALASGISGSERVAWKMRLDMLAGSDCGVKAKHKAYNLYTARSRRAGELLLCRAA